MEADVSLLACIDVLEDFRELGYESQLVFGGGNLCNSLFEGRLQLGGIVGSQSCIDLVVGFVCEDGLCAFGHVCKNSVESFFSSTEFFAAVGHLDGAPASPVVAVLRAGVLDADGQLAVFANKTDGVDRIAVCIGSSSHTCFAVNSIAEEGCTFLSGLLFVLGEVVAVDGKVVCACTFKVAVHLVHCIFHRYIVLEDCGEVVEVAVSIDTGSIVGAVAVVAGTEGSVCADEVVTGLQAFDGLVLVACYGPSFYACYVLSVLVLNLACACAEAVSPLCLCAFAEVVVGNEVADIGAGNVAVGNGGLEPSNDALGLSLDFVGCSGVVLYDELVRAERIVLCGLVVLGEVSFECVAVVAFEVSVGSEVSLDFLALSDVSLINGSVVGHCLLGSVHCVDGIGKVEDCRCLGQVVKESLVVIEHALCSDGLFYGCFLVVLDGVGYFAEFFFTVHAEVLFGCIDNGAVRGIGEGIEVLADVLIPEAGAELFAVGTPCQCAALEVFLADGGHLCTVAGVAVVDVYVVAVAVTCEVVCIVLDAFYCTYSEAVGDIGVAAQPARERAVLLRAVDVADHTAVVDGDVARGAHDATEDAGGVGTAVSRHVAAHHDALDVDVACPRSSHTNEADIAAAGEGATFVEYYILNIYTFGRTCVAVADAAITIDGKTVHNSDETYAVVVGMVDDEVADGVELSVEVAVEGSAFCADVSPTVAVAVHVDVVGQLSAGVKMLGSIVGPPYELCAVADFEPAVDGSQEVFLQAVADGAEAVVVLVRRQCAAAGSVRIGDVANGSAVATIACCSSIDECAVLLDRHRDEVFANLLVEAFYAALVAVQCISQCTALDVFDVFDVCGLFFVLIAVAVGVEDVGAGDVTGVTREGLGVADCTVERSDECAVGVVGLCGRPAGEACEALCHLLVTVDVTCIDSVVDDGLCLYYAEEAAGGVVTGMVRVDVDVGEDVAHLHAVAACMRADGACILSVGGDGAVHDDVLERTGEVGEQRGVAAHLGHLDGDGMAVAVEVTVEPVAGVEDVASGLGCVGYVVGQLEAEACTVCDAVPTLGNVDVRCTLDEVVAVLQVAFEGVDVEAAADCADTELVVLVSGGLHGAFVGEGELSLALAVALCGGGGKYLLAAEGCGNGERVDANLLCPGDVALVVVQLIADATVSQLVVGDDGDALGVAPCVGGIVVGACTAGTVAIDVLLVGLHVDSLELAIVTSDGAAVAVHLEFAAVVDDEAVDDVGTSVAPACDTAAVGGGCALDGELGETVLNHGTLIAYASNAGVSAIACYGADHVNVDVAATDRTVVPCHDTAGLLPVGGDGALNLQVLDEGIVADIAEDCGAVGTT